jgi:hypothetical protein
MVETGTEDFLKWAFEGGLKPKGSKNRRDGGSVTNPYCMIVQD